MSFAFNCSLDPTFLSTLKVHSTCATTVTDVNDSLALESFFLQQALSAAHAAKTRLLAAKVPFSRPATYHAHALKTGAHLLRIRQLQEKEAETQKAREEARKQRLLKKEAVKVQREREAERLKERKETMKMGKTMTGVEIEQALGNSNGTAKARQSAAAATKTTARRPSNPKRQAKDKKYGFGGKAKKMAKRNTKQSVDDMSGFSVKKMKSSFNRSKKGRN